MSFGTNLPFFHVDPPKCDNDFQKFQSRGHIDPQKVRPIGNTGIPLRVIMPNILLISPFAQFYCNIAVICSTTNLCTDTDIFAGIRFINTYNTNIENNRKNLNWAMLHPSFCPSSHTLPITLFPTLPPSHMEHSVLIYFRFLLYHNKVKVTFLWRFSSSLPHLPLFLEFFRF